MTTPASQAYFEEIEREALSSPTFPRLWGLNSSAAMMNPGELKRQYKAHQRAIERVSHMDNMARLGMGALGALAFLITGVVGLSSYGDEASLGIGAVGSVATVLVMVGMGFAVGWFLIGQVLAMRIQYKAVYGRTLVVDHPPTTDKGGWIVVGHTNLKRLGFISRTSQRYFFGPTHTANVADGMIVLEVPADSDKPLTSMVIQDLYHLPPGKGNLSGNSPSDTYAMVRRVQLAGEMERKMKRSKLRDYLTEGGFVLITALAIIAIFFQANSGFELDVTSLGLEDIKGVVQ